MGCPHSPQDGWDASSGPELWKLEMVFSSLASLQLFSQLSKSWLQTILRNKGCFPLEGEKTNTSRLSKKKNDTVPQELPELQVSEAFTRATAMGCYRHPSPPGHPGFCCGAMLLVEQISQSTFWKDP